MGNWERDSTPKLIVLSAMPDRVVSRERERRWMLERVPDDREAIGYGEKDWTVLAPLSMSFMGQERIQNSQMSVEGGENGPRKVIRATDSVSNHTVHPESQSKQQQCEYQQKTVDRSATWGSVESKEPWKPDQKQPFDEIRVADSMGPTTRTDFPPNVATV